MERFLRIVLAHNGHKPGNRATLHTLLEQATSASVGLIKLEDRAGAIQRISHVRNTIMHGNYEQAAEDCGCTVPEYFGKYFAAEVEGLFDLLNGFMIQIDYRTGRRRDG